MPFNFLRKKPQLRYVTSGAIKVTNRSAQVYVGCTKPVTVRANNRLVLNTGLHINIPTDCIVVVQLNPGITVSRGIHQQFMEILPGGFAGEVRIHMQNSTDRDYRINHKDLIANLHLIGDAQFTQCSSLKDVDPVAYSVVD